MKKILFSILCLAGLSSQQLHAQFFFVPITDFGTKLGYMNVGGKSGISYETNYSLEGSLFFGTRITYLFGDNANPKKHEDDGFGRLGSNIDNFFINFDAGAYVQYHFRNLMTNQKLNPYAEVYFSYKTIAPQVGIEYDLSNRFSVYLQAGHGVSNSFLGLTEDFKKNIAKDDSDDTFLKQVYGKRLFISAGFTYRILYGGSSSKRRKRNNTTTNSSRRSNSHAEKPEATKYRILD